ncbi:MAG: 5-formyltetrahydrofolate cyclo-ligase [Burkholderiaceae bacterium]
MDQKCVRADVRARLIARRANLPERERAVAGLAARVARWLAQEAPRCVGFYWPYRGEPDLRPVLAAWLAGAPGRRAALPVIVDGAMEFHAWSPAMSMVRGAYGIAVPAEACRVNPDAVLIPCVGFDAAGYRLGYGAGWYDRTLARLTPRPRTVGVAFEACRLESIDPESHDIPLDAILTEASETKSRT